MKRPLTEVSESAHETQPASQMGPGDSASEAQEFGRLSRAPLKASKQVNPSQSIDQSQFGPPEVTQKLEIRILMADRLKSGLSEALNCDKSRIES